MPSGLSLAKACPPPESHIIVSWSSREIPCDNPLLPAPTLRWEEGCFGAFGIFLFIVYVFCFIMYHFSSTERKNAAQTKTQCIITSMTSLEKPHGCFCFHYCSSPWLSPGKKRRISITKPLFPSSLTYICDSRDLGLPGAHKLILSRLVMETYAAFSLLSEMKWWFLFPTMKSPEQELMAGYFIFIKQQVSKHYAMHMPHWFWSGKVKC